METSCYFLFQIKISNNDTKNDKEEIKNEIIEEEDEPIIKNKSFKIRNLDEFHLNKIMKKQKLYKQNLNQKNDYIIIKTIFFIFDIIKKYKEKKYI